MVDLILFFLFSYRFQCLFFILLLIFLIDLRRNKTIQWLDSILNTSSRKFQPIADFEHRRSWSWSRIIWGIIDIISIIFKIFVIHWRDLAWIYEIIGKIDLSLIHVILTSSRGTTDINFPCFFISQYYAILINESFFHHDDGFGEVLLSKVTWSWRVRKLKVRVIRVMIIVILIVLNLRHLQWLDPISISNVQTICQNCWSRISLFLKHFNIIDFILF